MSKTLRVTFTVDVLEKSPMMLHEQLASGTYMGKKFSVIRSTGQNVHVVEYDGKSYQYTTENLMMAILSEVEKK